MQLACAGIGGSVFLGHNGGEGSRRPTKPWRAFFTGNTAAKLAGADAFIRRLPQGYDTELSGDGGSLSQGERQLLNIARAACAPRNPIQL